MEAKLSDSLKRVLSSPDLHGEAANEDAAKKPRAKIEPPEQSAPTPFEEIPMADIELEERIGIGNASTIFKGIWKARSMHGVQDAYVPVGKERCSEAVHYLQHKADSGGSNARIQLRKEDDEARDSFR